MASRCAPLRGIAGLLAVDAEIHFIGLVVIIQYNFFESVVEVVLQDVMIARSFAPGPARAAAAHLRFTLST